MENEKYKLFHQYSGMIVDEFKNEVDEFRNLNKLSSLQQEIFFRVIRPQRIGEELSERIKQNLDENIDKSLHLINSYMDYKENKITKNDFLKELVPGNAMQDIKSEMENKPQAIPLDYNVIKDIKKKTDNTDNTAKVKVIQEEKENNNTRKNK